MTPSQPLQTIAGHEFTADLLRMESFPVQYRVVAAVTARSGGHDLVLDRVERSDETVRLYLSFTLPARGEMVTMALVDHEVTHDAGTLDTSAVEVFVRAFRRDLDPEQSPYLLAAVAGR